MTDAARPTDQPVPLRLKTDVAIGFVFVHVLAALALLPWCFSWTGVILLPVSFYVFGTLGINLGYHRLLTHRGLVVPLWLEHTLALFGACALQFSPAFWVAIHRRHHHFTEEEQDPHSPLKSLFWAHSGWLLVRPDDMKRSRMIERYARDLYRDPFYVRLDQKQNDVRLGVLSWVAFFVIGFAASALTGGSIEDSLQFGTSLFVWAGPLRTVAVWHTTWAVNSIGHVWGYRNYQTPDDSRNNFVLGLLASGEGWHNNHHADPSSARHGHNGGSSTSPG